MRTNEAIATAEAVGEPEALVRTLRSTAEALLVLGDFRSALVILSRASDASASEGDNNIPFPAEDVLRVLVSRLDARQGHDVAALGRAVSLAPQM